MRADVGFDPRNVLTARLQMPGVAYPPERRTEIVDVKGSAPVVPISGDTLRPVGRFERRLRQDAAIYDGAAIHVDGPWKGLPYDPASATPVLQRGPRTQ